MVAAMANVCGRSSSIPSSQVDDAFASRLEEAGAPPIFAAEEDPAIALHEYVNEQSDLLVADSLFVRSAAQEALGFDLPDAHNPYLLDQLRE